MRGPCNLTPLSAGGDVFVKVGPGLYDRAQCGRAGGEASCARVLASRSSWAMDAGRRGWSKASGHADEAGVGSGEFIGEGFAGEGLVAGAHEESAVGGGFHREAGTLV